MKLQNSKKLIKQFEKTKSNLFPQRITQLVSRSYDKFIARTDKARASLSKDGGQPIPEVQSLNRRPTKATQQNLTLSSGKLGRREKDSLHTTKNNGISVDVLYNRRKTHYLDCIKQQQDRLRTSNSKESIRPKPLSVFNFSESFFYEELNVTKKRSRTHIHNKKSKHHSQCIKMPSTFMVEPNTTDNQARPAFFRTGKEEEQARKGLRQEEREKQLEQELEMNQEQDQDKDEQDEDEQLSFKIPERAKTNIFGKKRSHLKRALPKQISKTMPIKDYSPFKPVVNKKKDHFTFGIYERPLDMKNRKKLMVYHDFLWKVNYSNGLFAKASSKDANYKYYIGTGNNSNLIRSLMRRRFWWSSTDSSEACNFMWTQLRVGAMFDRQKQSEPSLQNLYSSSSKLQQFQEEQRQARHEGRIFGEKDLSNWCRHYNRNFKVEEQLSEKTFKKRGNLASLKSMRTVESPELLRVHNHFIKNGYFGNKKALFYLMKHFYSKKAEDVFDVLPLTFHICRGTEDSEWTHFQRVYHSFELRKQEVEKSSNIWIVKPGECSNQGNGISIYHDLEDIRLRVKSRERNRDGSLRTFILQKYIDNPFLYQGRKFDIRHYLLITCTNSTFKAYWFDEGYVRTASSSFSLRRGSNAFVHLTNDAVQKNSKDYGKFEDGNKISYEAINRYIRKALGKEEGSPFFDEVLPKMKAITVEAVKAAYLSLDPQRRTHNFELFGMDFMVDDTLKPWLIEINTNPCLETVCPLLSHLIPQLLEQTFNIALDTLFPPPDEWPTNKRMWLPDSLLARNRFQLIFDQAIEGDSVCRLIGSGFQLKKSMGKVEQESEVFASEGQLTEQTNAMNE